MSLRMGINNFQNIYIYLISVFYCRCQFKGATNSSLYLALQKQPNEDSLRDEVLPDDLHAGCIQENKTV